MRRNLTILITSLALVMALASIARRFWPASSPVNTTRFVGVGQTLAEETAKAVGDHGQIVAVLDDQLKSPGNPMHGQWKAFQQELAKHSSIRIVATEVVQPDPEEIRPGCPSGVFREILQRHAAVDAIVFFVGLADWSLLEARSETPASVAAKILVGENRGTPAQSEYDGYFSNGILTVLIAGKTGSAGDSPVKPKTPREWFDRYYQIYTPENYKELLH